MEARTSIAQNAPDAARPDLPIGQPLDERLVSVPPNVAELFRDLLSQGAADSDLRLLALMERQARRWEIKATLLEIAQGAMTEAAYWPQALGAIQRLFSARQAALWLPTGGQWIRAHATGPADQHPVAVAAPLLQETVIAGHVQTAAAKGQSGDLLLSLLGPVGPKGADGVIQVVLTEPVMRPDLEEDLTAAAAHVSAGLTAVRRLERFAYHASHDPLTGLANRRTFEAFVDREVKLSQRHGTPLSLLVIDADHFKVYNDTYGHPAGDALLQAIAGALGRAVRSTDFIARIGGEEFVVVLPHTAAEGAERAAHKVLESIRHLGDYAEVLSGRVTASVGVATCFGPTCSVEALFESADQAMYRAKRNGRDQVCQA